MVEQFSGWGLYDNSAICFTCGHQHLIPKSEQVTTQPWLDWLTKHDGHLTFIMKESELTKLGQQFSELKHNADVKTSYVASAAYTITLTGLATSSTLLAGREGTALSNASNKYLDVLVAAQVTTGTTPTDVKQIEFHIIGSQNDTPTYPDVFDGTDSAETITSVDIKGAICKLAGFSSTNNTSDRPYPMAPIGVASLFGGWLPVAHVPFITHNTGVNLNATAGNHYVGHTQVYATVA